MRSEEEIAQRRDKRRENWLECTRLYEQELNSSNPDPKALEAYSKMEKSNLSAYLLLSWVLGEGEE